jgi:class 3 adenylate cyclase
MKFFTLKNLRSSLPPVLCLLLPWVFWMATYYTKAFDLFSGLPTFLGIFTIGYIISAAHSLSNIVPRILLQSDHPYGDLMYYKNKSFAYQLAPILPALLFFFTSLRYIEDPQRMGPGIFQAVFGMITAYTFIAFYFSKEIDLIQDEISVKIFRTGLLKRFLMIGTISFIAILIFFYAAAFANSEDKSITLINPFRIFGDEPKFNFDPAILVRTFVLAVALYAINLPRLWRARIWLDGNDYFMVFLCTLSWASAILGIVFFLFMIQRLAGPGIGSSSYNFMIHQLFVLGFAILGSLYLALTRKERTIKNLRQPVWHYKKRSFLAWTLFFTACFTGSLFYTESSLYSVLASVLLFAAVCSALLSKRKLENLIQERTYELSQEKSKVDSLLLNILPAYVIEDLKKRGESQPRNFQDVAILFTDFVGFTKISTTMEPSDLINELNEMFTEFDKMVMRRGAERIKTIGDAYMAVSGLNESKQDPAAIMLECAKDILAYIKKRNEGRTVQWQIRIGFSVGRSVGGVVGKTKYLFDLFGDTINTASRMESNSAPMKINVSEQVYLRLKDQYEFIERDPVEVKGKGSIRMYFLKTD